MNRTPSLADREPTPKGLVLFPPGTDPARKRRRLLFAGCYFLVVLSLVWPIYPIFSSIRPLILGLPLSLAWIVLVLASGFLALLALYLTEDPDPEDGGQGET